MHSARLLPLPAAGFGIGNTDITRKGHSDMGIGIGITSIAQIGIGIGVGIGLGQVFR